MTEHVVVHGVRLACAFVGPEQASGPTLVFLHEGLGCLEMWRDFPAEVAARTGLRGLVSSRRGYGTSDPVPLPRPLTYMHDEALGALPGLLAAKGIDDVILVGHSDGASIALIFAGACPRARVRGLVLLAPHVFCEEVSVASIAEAREAFIHGDLAKKLARYHHDNTACAFWGWNDAWLDPGFRAWNIEPFLGGVACPILAIQGEDDRYGTLAQLDAIARDAPGHVTRLVLPGCGHDPARERREPTAEAIARFVATVAPPAPATSAP